MHFRFKVAKFISVLLRLVLFRLLRFTLINHHDIIICVIIAVMLLLKAFDVTIHHELGQIRHFWYWIKHDIFSVLGIQLLYKGVLVVYMNHIGHSGIGVGLLLLSFVVYLGAWMMIAIGVYGVNIDILIWITLHRLLLLQYWFWIFRLGGSAINCRVNLLAHAATSITQLIVWIFKILQVLLNWWWWQNFLNFSRAANTDHIFIN